MRCQALGPPRSLWLCCGACVEDPGCWGPLLSCPSAWVKTSLLYGLWNDRGCPRGDPLPGCVHAGHSGYLLGLRPPFSVPGKQPAQVSSLRHPQCQTKGQVNVGKGVVLEPREEASGSWPHSLAAFHADNWLPQRCHLPGPCVQHVGGWSVEETETEINKVGEGSVRHQHTHTSTHVRTRRGLHEGANPVPFIWLLLTQGSSPSAKGHGPLYVLPGAVGRVGMIAHDLCPVKTPKRCQGGSPG